MSRRVRTRFAPSPTGFQHIGGFRTAFFAWLLARHHGGDFILRIEDTDRERLVPGAIKFILEELAWFGVDIDEGPTADQLKAIGEEVDTKILPKSGDKGPYIQSLRLPRYKVAAEELIQKGHAYRCDCTPEMLEQERAEQMARKEVPGYSGYCRSRNVSENTKHVVRFKMPYKPTVTMIDAVKGRVSWENPPLKDPVILKSDGFPTYHLAVVVDDHDMEISHAMRGDEWLPSTPLHLLIYEAFGWEPPVFAHLPVILGESGKKLSKREGAATSSELRAEGYLPEALLNFVALIGWSPGEGEEQEVFSRDELIKRFSLERINNASGVFQNTKLQWMNGKYIRDLKPEEFLERVKPFFEKANIPFNKDLLLPLSPHLQERAKTLSEVPPMTEFLTKDVLKREWEGVIKKDVTKEVASKLLASSLEVVKSTEPFAATSLDAALRAKAESLGVKVGQLFSLTRIAVLEKAATPPLFESLEVLGKGKVLQRIEEAIEELRA